MLEVAAPVQLFVGVAGTGLVKSWMEDHQGIPNLQVREETFFKKSPQKTIANCFAAKRKAYGYS